MWLEILESSAEDNVRLEPSRGPEPRRRNRAMPQDRAGDLVEGVRPRHARRS
jgi:hypothetical protein